MARDGRPFWSTRFGRLLLTLLVAAVAVCGGVYWLLHSITHPDRDRTRLDPADLLLRAEEIAFTTADGVTLSGWFVQGAIGGPPIVLCHDLGRSRMSLVHTAVSLNRAGYPLLLFDFRGHGQSTGRGSSLGNREVNDVAAALDWLKQRKGVDRTRIGSWGIGMGAYAAAMAALDRPEVVALVLDAPYAAIPDEIDRRVREMAPPPLHRLVPLLHRFYPPYFLLALDENGLRNGLGRLARKNTLILGAPGDPERLREGRALYDLLPQDAAADKNFIELKAAIGSALYAEDKKAYDTALLTFFRSYLPLNGAARITREAGIKVLER